MDSTTLRRAILLALVLAAISTLYGCGVTPWHQIWDAHQDLNSPAMNARIAEAQR